MCMYTYVVSERKECVTKQTSNTRILVVELNEIQRFRKGDKMTSPDA